MIWARHSEEWASHIVARFRLGGTQTAAAVPTVILRSLLPDPIVPCGAELVLAAVTDIGPAPLPVHVGRIDTIAVTALGLADSQVVHHGSPLGAVRWCPAVARNGHQVGDFVRHGGGDEVITMVIGEPQIETQHRRATMPPDALAGGHAGQVESDLGCWKRPAELTTQG